jgi:hypothetical protein
MQSRAWQRDGSFVTLRWREMDSNHLVPQKVLGALYFGFRSHRLSGAETR